jgi:hypothetical protein
MHLFRTALSSPLALLLSFPLTAQQPTTTAPRDVQSLNVLSQAVTAQGGSSNLLAIKDLILKGSLQTYPIGNAPSKTRNFTWTIASTEFRQEVNDASTSSAFLSGHGTPVSVRNGVSARINYHVAQANLPFYIPGYVLLNELSDPRYTIKYIGPATVEGKPALQVHITDDTDPVGQLVTPQEWYFDPVTFLPLRVEYRLPTNQNAAVYSAAAFEFFDYRAVNGVIVPYQLTYFRDGKPFASVSVSNVTLNSGVLPSAFDANVGSAQ